MNRDDVAISPTSYNIPPFAPNLSLICSGRGIKNPIVGRVGKPALVISMQQIQNGGTGSPACPDVGAHSSAPLVSCAILI